MPLLEIRLLGSFHVTLDGQPLTEFRSDKVRALLAYLVMEHNRPLRRAHLVDLLWSGYTPDTALNSLAKSLTNLRSLLAAVACLKITRHTVEFDATAEGVWCDALAFAHALEVCQQHAHPNLARCARCRAQLQQATSLYQGEFVRGLCSHDEQPFDAWREKTQAQFQGIFDTMHRILQTPLAPPRHNLPRTLNRFFGREQEIAALSDLLRSGEAPLLTLIGEGGVGKTRLALAVAAQVKEEYGDGAWFVPLTPLPPAMDGLDEPLTPNEDRRAVQVYDRIAVAIAKSLGLALVGTDPPHLQLIRQLRQRHLLLILDNFEHQILGASWLPMLVSQAQHVYVLVTSRQRLGLQAEHVLRVHGLPVPPRRAPWNRSQTDAAGEDLAQVSSVRLFMARAERVGVTVPLNPETRAAMISICQALEGLPLGIELAAMLLDHQSLAAVESTLLSSLASLTTSESDISPHHRSLRAVFEQSWHGLNAAEARLLARCSVFRGGFTEAAAAAVAAAAPGQLTILEHRSVLRRADEGRYDMHEMMRQFAAAKLLAAGEAQSIASKHSQYYLAQLMPTQHRQDIELSDCQRALPAVALAMLVTEIDNIRQAWQQAVAERRFAELGQAADGLGHLLGKVGLLREGQALFDRTCVELSAAGAPASVLSGLNIQHAMLCDRHVKYAETAAAAQRALAFATTDLEQARAYLWCGTAQWKLDNLAATSTMLQQALQIFRRYQHTDGEANCLHELGSVAYRQGNLASAQERWEKALALNLQTGCKRRAAGTLNNLSSAYADCGAYQQADACIREGLRLLAEAGGHPVIQGYLLANEARVSLLLGDYQNAGLICAHALEHSRNIQNQELESCMLAQQAWLAYYAGADAQACQLAEAAVVLSQEIRYVYAAGMALPVLGHAQRRQGNLAAASDSYRAAVQMWEQHALAAPEFALDSLAGLALISWEQSQVEEARRQVNEILDTLARVSWDQEMIAEPVVICLACYDVLVATGDPRADMVLQQAWRFVRERADRISDPALHDRFLDGTAVHRQIMALIN